MIIITHTYKDVLPPNLPISHNFSCRGVQQQEEREGRKAGKRRAAVTRRERRVRPQKGT
jgi:hypothetical protein